MSFQPSNRWSGQIVRFFDWGGWRYSIYALNSGGRFFVRRSGAFWYIQPAAGFDSLAHAQQFVEINSGYLIAREFRGSASEHEIKPYER